MITDSFVSTEQAKIKTRAVLSIVIVVVGIGAVMIPWLGTLLVLFLGWIPLLIWFVVGIRSLRESVRLQRIDLIACSAITITAPIVVYGFHLWVISQGH